MPEPQPFGNVPVRTGWAGVKEGNKPTAQRYVAIDKGVIFFYESNSQQQHTSSYNLRDSICNNTLINDDKGQKTALKITGPKIPNGGFILQLATDAERIEWASTLIDASIAEEATGTPPLPPMPRGGPRGNYITTGSVGSPSPPQFAQGPSSTPIDLGSYEAISFDKFGTPQVEGMSVRPSSVPSQDSRVGMEAMQKRAEPRYDGRKPMPLPLSRSDSHDSDEDNRPPFPHPRLGLTRRGMSLQNTSTSSPLSLDSSTSAAAAVAATAAATGAAPPIPIRRQSSLHSMPPAITKKATTGIQKQQQGSSTSLPMKLRGKDSNPSIPEDAVKGSPRSRCKRSGSITGSDNPVSSRMERSSTGTSLSSEDLTSASVTELLGRGISVAHLPEEEGVFVARCMHQAKALLQQAMAKMYLVERELEAAEREREEAAQAKRQALEILRQAKGVK